MKILLFQIGLLSSLVLATNSSFDEEDSIFLKSSVMEFYVLENENLTILYNHTILRNSVRQVYLHNDSIQEIKEDALTGLPNLMKLSLVGNNLTSLRGIGNLPNLTQLILNKNSISSIKEGDITNLSSLVILDLSENNLSQIYADFFNFLPSLRNFNVSYNKLSEIPESFINISLSTLDGSYNILTELDIKNVTDAVYLSHNSFSDIRFAETVTRIEFSHNELTNLWSALDDLYNLTSADFSHNNIEYIWINHNRNLKSFNLSYNSLNQINGGYFNNQEKLEVLDLSNNEIEELDYGCFTGLSELTYLDLSKNNISKWHALYTLDKVQQLSLRDNLFESLNPKLILEHLKHLHTLTISFTSISCEELLWAIQILTEGKIDILVEFDSIGNTSNVHGMQCDDTKKFFNVPTINEIRIVHVIEYVDELYSLLIVVLVVCMVALIVKMFKFYRVSVAYVKESKSAKELHSCSLKLLSETDSVDC